MLKICLKKLLIFVAVVVVENVLLRKIKKREGWLWGLGLVVCLNF
jgi:hypothetical protein